MCTHCSCWLTGRLPPPHRLGQSEWTSAIKDQSGCDGAEVLGALHVPSQCSWRRAGLWLPATCLHCSSSPMLTVGILWANELGFPGGLVVKNLPANTGDSRSIPGLGRCPGGGNGDPLQYSCWRNPRDRGAWRAAVHRVSWTWLSTQQILS